MHIRMNLLHGWQLWNCCPALSLSSAFISLTGCGGFWLCDLCLYCASMHAWWLTDWWWTLDFAYRLDTDSGLGRATPPRRAPSPGMTASGRHMPSPSGPGSLPPGLISKRRGFDDGSSDYSLTANAIMEYSGLYLVSKNSQLYHNKHIQSIVHTPSILVVHASFVHLLERLIQLSISLLLFFSYAHCAVQFQPYRLAIFLQYFILKYQHYNFQKIHITIRVLPTLYLHICTYVRSYSHRPLENLCCCEGAT